MSAPDNIKRICLWSSPRNISTALMYSFAQRSDTKVFDEPFYGFYLSHSEAHSYHPVADQIMGTMENDGDKVIEMILGPHEKPVVFFKNMTHHMLDLDWSFTREVFNVILTRDPKEMLTSFIKVVPHPKMEDVGYQGQAALLKYFKANDCQYTVLDSKDVLLDPKKELRTLCNAARIAFDERMLSWKPGKIPDDGVWADHWYGSVHKSSGFVKYEKKPISVPEDSLDLLRICEAYYQDLLSK